MSSLELFDLRLAALANDADVFPEGIGGRVGGKASLVLPCFAEHENAGARCTLANVAGDATGVRERLADESFRGGNRLGVAAFPSLEETVVTYHEGFPSH